MPESIVQAELDRSPGRILSWGAYLACSWTWCIGMFLPILLWRDFGVWGFVAFAVPNIIGAAEMGFVLAKPGSSERFVTAHAPMCRLFSLVTIAFQMFFLVWLAQVAFPLWVSVAGALLVGFLTVRPRTSAREWRDEAPMALGISLFCAGWFIYRRGGIELAPGPGGVSALDLGSLGLVCALGFVLCPYLDLTFHRARRSTAPAAGKVAFAIGFGVLFAAMIAFTAIYAVELLRVGLDDAWSASQKYLMVTVVTHIMLQLLFTIGVHSSELRREQRGMDWALAAALAVGCALGSATSVGPGYAGLSFGEVVYRLFMAFYGLVFPAYVWICCSPIARTAPPTKRMLGVWAGAVAVATPFFWMGFIEREAWWLLPGVGIVVAARLVRGSGTGSESDWPRG